MKRRKDFALSEPIEAAQAAFSFSESHFPAQDSAKFSILVVDDEPCIRALLHLTLTTTLPSEVTEAASAKEAISLLEKRSFHLIVSDLSMEDSGLDILKFLQHQNLPTPMILFSGNVFFTLPTAPQLLGFFEKPDYEKLVTHIRSHLGQLK